MTTTSDQGPAPYNPLTSNTAASRTARRTAFRSRLLPTFESGDDKPVGGTHATSFLTGFNRARR